MAAMSEIIEWKRPEDELPDADLTVLMVISGEAEVYLGYFEGTCWCDADGFPIPDDVLFWSHMPEGPQS